MGEDHAGSGIDDDDSVAQRIGETITDEITARGRRAMN